MSATESGSPVPKHEQELVKAHRFSVKEWIRYRSTGELPARVRDQMETRLQDQMRGSQGEDLAEEQSTSQSPDLVSEFDWPKTEEEFKSWSLSTLHKIQTILSQDQVSLSQLEQTLSLIEHLSQVRTAFINLVYGSDQWQQDFVGQAKQIEPEVRGMVIDGESIQYQFVALQIYTYVEDWINLTGYNNRQETTSLMKDKIQAEEWELIAKVLSSKTNVSYLLTRILLKTLRRDYSDGHRRIHHFDFRQIIKVVTPALIEGIAFRIGDNGYEMIAESSQCLELILESFAHEKDYSQDIDLNKIFSSFLKAVIQHSDRIRGGKPSHVISRQILAVIRKFIRLVDGKFNPPKGTEEFLNKLYYEKSVRYNDQELGNSIKSIAAEFDMTMNEG
jgi:hypothetical protein